jgi:rod shape determining protein RodA
VSLRESYRLAPGGRGPLGVRGVGGLPRGGPGGPRSISGRPSVGWGFIKNLDWILIAVVLALCVLGTLLVWSATKPQQIQIGASSREYLYKDVLWFGIGLMLMLGVAALDIRRIRSWTPVVYGLTMLGLLAVLTPVGSVVNGAHAWINLPGGFQIEPSEFAKLGLVLICAMVLSRLGDGGKRPRLREIGLTVLLAAPLAALVIKEPALGVALVLLVVLAGMISVSGLRLRWLAILAVGGTGAVYGAIKLHVLKSYQLQRFTSFTNPSANLAGSGYNAQQAKIAVGSGGMYGHGLFHGTLIAGGYVPSQSTDFIFTVAGEELGFVGCIAIIVLLGIVITRALRIAAKAEDQFGMLAATGIAIWFAFQAFVNIGMTIGIMPITGLPLPFISYGGSAAFADMIAIGILQSVNRKRTGMDAIWVGRGAARGV